MKHAKPQAGNPHKITVKQHVLPRKSIARFAASDGLVSVYLCKNRKIVRLAAKDVLFCVRRVWHQNAEVGYFKKIEDSFQSLCEQILGGDTYNQSSKNNEIISLFYSLWRLRAELKSAPLGSIKSPLDLPGSELTKDEEEILEKNGCFFYTKNGMSSQQHAAMALQIGVTRLIPLDTEWGLAQSASLEFIVPDSFGDIGIVPLSPTLCFVANAPSGNITDDNVAIINKIAIEKSTEYYFARILPQQAK